MYFSRSYVSVVNRLLLPGLALFALASALPAPAAVGGARASRLQARPALAFTSPEKQIVLEGPYAQARVLVEERRGAQSVQDVSAKVEWQIANPAVARMDGGTLRPLKDGKTVLTARLDRRVVRVPVVVRGMAKAAPPRFLADVLPVLTKVGCNQGACHGAGSGKGGFKLSLLGYDPEADYDAITRTNGARRIARAEPENSLILRKPTFRVRHRGGRLFDVGSPQYRVLCDWIAGGLPGPVATDPRVVRLEATPAVRTLAIGQTQAFAVRARYSDGSVRDVTGQTLFTPSDGTVASVTPSGIAKVVGMGEAAVLIRYRGLVATAQIVSPFAPPLQASAAHPNAAPVASRIDALILHKLAGLGLRTSDPCSDSDFLRRAYLDVIGILPTPDEARAFLADRDPKKREKHIDALLERPEYVDFWTLRWGDLLRCSRDLLTDRGMYALNAWIRRGVAENRPWDRFARELLLARGSGYATGPANFYRAADSPGALAETTSQIFLGVRIECAKCHNHPYEKWTQNQYYQMAAFFARVQRRPGDTPGENVVFVADSGEVRHPKTRREVVAAALDAAPLPAGFQGDRRQALAEWLTSDRNPFFAHSIVNRIWRHFMGRGFVEPVDDLRVTNPPSNAALFDWLARDFTQHGYDLKYLIRAIMRTQAYQRSAQPMRGNGADNRYYSHFLLKRLGAEQLMDALSAATGVPAKFAGYPAGMRAAQLPDTTAPSYFLDLFGRPARKVTCECERTDAPSLGQVLHFMNGKDINDRLTAQNGRVATLLAAKLPDRAVVEALYLATMTRFPTAAESRKATGAFSNAKDRRKAAEDLLWALLNSNEFLFNH